LGGKGKNAHIKERKKEKGEPLDKLERGKSEGREKRGEKEDCASACPNYGCSEINRHPTVEREKKEKKR